MATINSIGTSKDYGTITLWESDTDNNLSGLGEFIGEVYDNNSGSVTISGSSFIMAGATNTSASDFRHLRAHSSVKHAGKWDTSKLNIQFSSTSTIAFDIQEAFFKLSYMQVKNTHGTSPTGVIKLNNVASIIVEECIAACDVAAGGDDNGGFIVGGAGATSVKIRNCIAHGMRAGVVCDNASSTAELDNCATVNCTFGIRATAAIGSNLVIKNHYSGGNSTNNFNETGSGDTNFTFTTSAQSDSTETDANVTDNVAFSTANFTNVTAGSEDLHLVTGSALINVGTDLSSTFTVDINGNTRPTGASTWDIGPDEFGAGGGGGSGPAKSLRVIRNPSNYLFVIKTI